MPTITVSRSASAPVRQCPPPLRPRRPSPRRNPPPLKLRRASPWRSRPLKPEAPAGERLVHVANLRDAAAEGDRVKELYDRLAEARKQTGEAPLAFDRVAALVKAQMEKYSAGGGEVAFRVAMKDGKVSLTVKPVKDGE